MVRTGFIAILIAAGLGAGALAQAQGSRDSAGSSPASMSEREEAQARLDAFGGERAVARARRDATLAFAFAADVERVFVQGGQVVKRGEPLVKGWDADIQAAVALQRTLAESTVEIEAAAAELAQAKIELESVKAASAGAAASSIEVQRRENAVRSAEAAEELAKRKQLERRQELTQREAQASRYTLTAPFDGVVDLITVSEGQSVDRAQAVVRVVDVGALQIDVAAAAAETLRRGLQAGDAAWVMFEVDEASRVFSGRVLQVSPVADASSGRRMVRVEMENTAGWPAGMLCRVRFDAPDAERAR